MSNQIRLGQQKPATRAPGLLGFYPCFQVSPDAFLADRSTAGNNAAFGAALTASAAWAVANRLTMADANAGTNAGGPFIPSATVAFNPATDSLLICGIWNGANTATRYSAGNGGIAGAAGEPHGFWLRSMITTGKGQLGWTSGASGTTSLGNISTLTIGDGTDHHIGILVNGPSKRVSLYIDGVNDTSNNVTGADWSGQSAAMTTFGPIVFGGVPILERRSKSGHALLTHGKQHAGWVRLR